MAFHLAGDTERTLHATKAATPGTGHRALSKLNSVRGAPLPWVEHCVLGKSHAEVGACFLPGPKSDPWSYSTGWPRACLHLDALGRLVS